MEESDSNLTNSTNQTNSSILSKTSEFYNRNKGIIKNFRKTLNLALVLAILYYVTTNNNITMENVPKMMVDLKQLLDSARNISHLG